MSGPGLISYFEVLAMLFEHAPPTEFETVPIEKLRGRMLGEPVVAPRDHPMFDASAVDGYAISETDVSLLRDAAVRVQISATIGPGQPVGDARVWPGHAVQVLTGASVPPGTAAVVMQEQARVSEAGVEVSGSATVGDHIRRQGEEFANGDRIVPGGVRANAGVVAAAAMTGKANWRVGLPPSVAIVVTGDELVPVGGVAEDLMAFDSHTPALSAALFALGVEPVQTARCGDGEQVTEDAIRAALSVASVVITTGGVSGGERDYVRRVLAACGVDEVFAGVRMKPGRPVLFGVGNTSPPRYVFGLPGNPMAALVAFTVLVKPFLLEASGLVKAAPEFITAALATPVESRRSVTEFVPVILKAEGGRLVATPLEGRRSHMFGGLALANGLAMLPERDGHFDAGAEVPVMRWGG